MKTTKYAQGWYEAKTEKGVWTIVKMSSTGWWKLSLNGVWLDSYPTKKQAIQDID